MKINLNIISKITKSGYALLDGGYPFALRRIETVLTKNQR